MPEVRPTNAASSGVTLDKKTLKALSRRSDRPGLLYLALWGGGLCLSGSAVWLSLGSLWLWPAMLLHGTLMTLPAYAMSHEAAHGTAFRSRWLNETVFWLTSLLYMEEPLHRRYTHTNHHTFTWHVGKDSQMPFDTPMDLKGWASEVSGLALLRFHLLAFWTLASGRYSAMLKLVTPAGELPKMRRNASIFLAIYAALLAPLAFGFLWPLWFLILPRLLGAPAMLLFTLIQHVELKENAQSVLESTRSFRTGWLGRFLYMNMNNHVEHHLYPQVPFHALPKLAKALADQVPTPDPGVLRTNWEVFLVVLRRTLGGRTKAPSIRQAPHMITEGGYRRIAQRTM